MNTHETSASPITSKNKKTPEGLLRSEKHADGATSGYCMSRFLK